MSPTICHKYKYFHAIVQRGKGKRQKFHFCRLPFDVRARNVKLNLTSSDLLTAERGRGGGGGPLYGLYELCHGIGLTVFENLDPYKGYYFCPCLHCVPSVILRQVI